MNIDLRWRVRLAERGNILPQNLHPCFRDRPRGRPGGFQMSAGVRPASPLVATGRTGGATEPLGRREEVGEKRGEEEVGEYIGERVE